MLVNNNTQAVTTVQQLKRSDMDRPTPPPARCTVAPCKQRSKA